MYQMMKQLNTEITEVFSEALRDNMAMSYNEKAVLQGTYNDLAQDVVMGVDNGCEYKLMGILDFLRSCRKIDEEADEQLSMLMNRIEKEKYA